MLLIVRKIDNFGGAITLERAIEKRSKELEPKLEQISLIAKEKLQNCYHNMEKWNKIILLKNYIKQGQKVVHKNIS